jgi:hypothetical protein
MTSAVGLPHPVAFPSERQRVLDDLNLSMLFLDTARVEAVTPPRASPGRLGDIDRRLRLRVLARHPLTPAGTAALLCRVLHNRRIPSVEITRLGEGVRLRCAYLLPAGAWQLEITAPVL